MSYASDLLGLPSGPTEPRTKRMEHNHITQKKNGVPGCPACESIRLDVMTYEFGIMNHRWLLANGIIPMYGNW